ncbi:NAD(P)/FAD-dependent oxidoreductase [Hymenobacter sp. BT175]|uniref:NAD(P)/FAD-dependent oxidoreductase n=1 Tax=Hymenobacter translucens TaxID=2886507 RepID=UPI001D0F08F1|nr:NAD(P)/FAD-dependent oxidoreductase [Hymenobacter translucens]MCC2545572.1 NAD(P)/FAD-dependent oxidoreductase [Hymenobacter translucens]
MSTSLPRFRPADQPLTDYDVIIIGAGSAGLSAALVLGRCARSVLVCDGGSPRNAPSPAVQGFMTRDGTRPAELLRLARRDLEPYTTVEIRESRVIELSVQENGFEVTAETDATRPFRATARKVLLATGVADELPPIDGMRELWGRGVLHCPYCHGWEVREQPLAVYGRGKGVTGLALLVSRWSKDVVVCTDGPGGLTDKNRQRLAAQGIGVREEAIVRLEGSRSRQLKQVVFTDAEPLPRHALFVHPHQHQRTTLAETVGCRITAKHAVWTDKKQQTSVFGLYAAGDTTAGLQQAMLAAAEGAKAGININERLTKEECR